MNVLENKSIRLESARIPEREIKGIYALIKTDADGCILSNKFAYPSRNYCDAAFEIWLGVESGCPSLYLSDGNGHFLNLNAEGAFVADGEYHHLAVSIGDEVSVWIDGRLCAKDTEAAKALDSFVLRSKLLVAHSFDNLLRIRDEFSGEIAKLCLWSREISPEIGLKEAIDTQAEELIAFWEPKNGCEDLSGNKMDLTPYKYIITAQDEEFEEFSAPAAEGEFTIAFIPDTQTTMFRKELKEKDFSAIYDWLIANKEKYNIQMAVSLGDITEHSSRETDQEFDEECIAQARKEWKLASDQFARLGRAEIPWAAIPGNHDYGTGGTGRREAILFNEAFPYDEISRFPYFGGAENAPESVTSAYYYLSAPNGEYLILCLENEPRDHILKWANEVIEAHPNHKIIVATHENIGKDASYTKPMFLLDENGDFVYTPEGWKKSFRGTYQADLHYECGASGGKLWDELICRHKNIQMVLCGHLDTANIVSRVDEGVFGNKVFQAVIDTQGIDWSLNSASAVALARINAETGCVSWRLVSTSHGEQKEYTDENGNQSTYFEGWFLDEDSNRLTFKP